MALLWMVGAICMMIAAALCVLYMALIPDEDAWEPPAAKPVETAILDPVLIEPLDFQAAITDEEITLAAKTVWGEAHGVESRMEQAAVVWCALNRVEEWGDPLWKIVTAKHQFAYDPENPTVDDFGRDLEELVRDVVARWEREQNGDFGVGRVLPHGYLFFGGDGEHNYFRREYDDFGSVWGWHLPNPYEEAEHE